MSGGGVARAGRCGMLEVALGCAAPLAGAVPEAPTDATLNEDVVAGWAQATRRRRSGCEEPA